MSCHDHLYQNVPPDALARRWFLKECGVGLGAIALGQLAQEQFGARNGSAYTKEIATSAAGEECYFLVYGRCAQPFGAI